MANDSNQAVVRHLIRLIQDSADVRHCIGGAHTQMRELLVAAIRDSGFEGDPLAVLKPAAHRADEEPRVLRMERARDRLADGLDKVREAVMRGRDREALTLIERLTAGEAV